jgi:hypothetical protein
LIKLVLTLIMTLVVMRDCYNPSGLRVPVSTKELTNVDVATLSAEERRDNDVEVAYCVSACVTNLRGTNFVTGTPYQSRYSHKVVCIVGLTKSLVTKIFVL